MKVDCAQQKYLHESSPTLLKRNKLNFNGVILKHVIERACACKTRDRESVSKNDFTFLKHYLKIIRRP